MTFKKGQRIRPKTDITRYVASCYTVANRLRSDYGIKGCWKEVGRIYGVTGTLAHMVAIQGYEPRSPELRRKLGFPIFTKVELITSAPCQDGTQILEVRECCNRNCKRPFVPNVPSRRQCYRCAKKR